MFVGIKNGKIHDICSDLRHKRDDSISDKDYLSVENNDLCINDTWDLKTNINLKDSPQRFIEPESTELELLQEKIQSLEETQSLMLKQLEELEK